MHPEVIVYAAHCGSGYGSVFFGDDTSGAGFSVATEYCQTHPSFGGIAIQLTADGYSQLPTIKGGYDDDTVALRLRQLNVAERGVAGDPPAAHGCGAPDFGQA